MIQLKLKNILKKKYKELGETFKSNENCINKLNPKKDYSNRFRIITGNLAINPTLIKKTIDRKCYPETYKIINSIEDKNTILNTYFELLKKNKSYKKKELTSINGYFEDISNPNAQFYVEESQKRLEKTKQTKNLKFA